MSHKARILGAKVTGHPFLGLEPPRAEDGSRLEGPQVPVWSADPHRVLDWMASAYRLRLNDHRALRCKYLREPDPDNPGKKRRVLDNAGDPVLVPIGSNPVKMTTPQARKARPHLAAAPDLMLHAATREEETSWFAAAKRRKTRASQGMDPGSMPGMYFRGQDRRFAIFHNNGRNAVLYRTGRRTGVIVIAGMNPPAWRGGFPARWGVRIRIRLTRQVSSYSSVVVNLNRNEVALTTPPMPAGKRGQSGSITGIDRGVAHAAASSDGAFFDAPDVTAEEQAIKHHSRKMANTRRINNPTGSKNWKPTKGYLRHRKDRAQAHQRKTAKITDFQHKATTHLVRTHDFIAMESLTLTNMMRSAKGTAETPGKNVAQKAGLNRALAAAALGRFGQMVHYKSQALVDAGFDQRLALVPAPNTSRMCNECGHIGEQNRKSQADFCCTGCGHTAHADTNAALNVDDAAMSAWGWTVGEPTPSGALLVVAPAGSQDKTDPAHAVPKLVAEGGTGVELRTPAHALGV